MLEYFKERNSEIMKEFVDFNCRLKDYYETNSVEGQEFLNLNKEMVDMLKYFDKNEESSSHFSEFSEQNKNSKPFIKGILKKSKVEQRKDLMEMEEKAMEIQKFYKN